jgi:hypothetical protein
MLASWPSVVLVVVGDAGGADHSSRNLRTIVGHAPAHVPRLTKVDHVAIVVRAVKRAVLGLEHGKTPERSLS